MFNILCSIESGITIHVCVHWIMEELTGPGIKHYTKFDKLRVQTTQIVKRGHGPLY